MYQLKFDFTSIPKKKTLKLKNFWKCFILYKIFQNFKENNKKYNF